MIYRMLVLFTCCWGSNLSIQAELGKLNGDLLQLSGIRYKVWSFSVRHLISIAYWEGLISGVKLSVVVPQAIGISLRNSMMMMMLLLIERSKCWRCWCRSKGKKVAVVEDWRWRLYDVENIPMIYRCIILMMMLMMSSFSYRCCCWCCCRIPF